MTDSSFCFLPKEIKSYWPATPLVRDADSELYNQLMKLSIFGIGYVGCVSAACFAREGHQVIAVDVNPVKVGMINSGQCPIVEADIAELVSSVVSQNQLKSTTDVVAAVKGSDLSLVCVGTPS